ncbi:MAG: PepSY domain-containing protein [Bdellovibrionaceae bacterium]|nr:PepSY domain-containing protein [Pseudobdellovibrionaceae bacterium]
MTEKLLKIFRFSKSTHKWIAIICALPLIIMIATGLLLSISSQVQWLQPTPVNTNKGSGISLSFDRILEIAQTVPEAEIRDWGDVAQIDARPKAGVVRVRAKNYWEVQIHGQTGDIISSAKRWKTFFILVHDGSWFAGWVKSWVFLPAGIGALVLWISGILIWIIPIIKKRGKA